MAVKSEPMIKRRILSEGKWQICKLAYDEKRLDLAYQGLINFPEVVIEKYGCWPKMLDLTNNKFKDLQFLKHFSNLTTLILDHNNLKTDSEFPNMFSLHTLWINFNRITELAPFVIRLSRRCPNLKYLSMMQNPATPSSFGIDSYAHLVMYRYYTISCFAKLERLDDQNITNEERKDAIEQINNLYHLQELLPKTYRYPYYRDNLIV